MFDFYKTIQYDTSIDTINDICKKNNLDKYDRLCLLTRKLNLMAIRIEENLIAKGLMKAI